MGSARLWRSLRLSRRARLAVVTGAVLAAGTFGAAKTLGPAGATPTPGSNGRLVCTASASATPTSTGSGTWSWRVHGVGSCVDSAGGYSLSFTASGTSEGLGLCDGAVMRNLGLSVNTRMQRISTGETFTPRFVWSAPVSTFPLVTPFLVGDPQGTSLGAGNLDTRIFLRCPGNGGTSDAQVQWTVLI